MTSKAERIAAAVAELLTSPAMTSVPPTRIFRDLYGAIDGGALPAIAIETGNEEPGDRAVIGFVERVLDVRLHVVAMGEYAAGDPALVEAYARIAADPTLAGLAFDFQDAGTQRERDQAERRICLITKTLRYRYRTTEESLET